MPKNIRGRIEELSALGAENELLLPHIELSSNREATVEGSCGIIEYDKSVVRLNCRGITVKFSGDCLCINNLSGDRVSVTGDILALEFGT
ncbi:MAG: YabP/YqfC family sporulation protein [Oscillospiraceae bacterium]|nr:YabP/YqfC family sporulation protein [Oscillospiraceae bacterium]MDD7293617.1 YabP/YqfC family sporulation protein [Clostridiaceae bacterium]MDY5990549.1 YabP/YqfC family sporulation protein [Oscillospiraceae bacterium]